MPADVEEKLLLTSLILEYGFRGYTIVSGNIGQQPQKNNMHSRKMFIFVSDFSSDFPCCAAESVQPAQCLSTGWYVPGPHFWKGLARCRGCTLRSDGVCGKSPQWSEHPQSSLTRV